ncbi:RVP_2 domain-containing protein, partial [Cephalotus follicularis]
FEVALANGEKISSAGHCKGVCMTMQGVPLKIDIYLLPLEGIDAILGVQWLSTLGPILWDFSKLQTLFNIDSKEVVLQGLKIPASKLVDEVQFSNELKKEKKVILLQINALTLTTQSSNLVSNDYHGAINKDLGYLLPCYADFFKEPQGLPPQKIHDHQIPLKDGSQPISVRPYCYPHYQKTEIDKMVVDLLKSGVIRPS